LTILVA